MKKEKRPNDIKAPDGILLGGERLVRKNSIILFGGERWRIPDYWAEQGQYVWVHATGGYWLTGLDVAHPGYDSFSGAVLDGQTVEAELIKPQAISTKTGDEE